MNGYTYGGGTESHRVHSYPRVGKYLTLSAKGDGGMYILLRTCERRVEAMSGG